MTTSGEPGANIPLQPLVFETLAHTPAVLRSLLGGVPEPVLETARDGAWAPKDLVAHLLSIHFAGNVQRARIILENDDPDIPGVDEAAVLEASGMRAWPLDRLLAEFEAARAESLTWLRTLTDAQLARSGRHAVVGRITVADVLHHIAYHDLVHVRQLLRMLESPLEPRRGAMRQAMPAD